MSGQTAAGMASDARREGTRYRFSGHERILHRTSAHEGLPP